jgi:hypothetical protein
MTKVNLSSHQLSSSAILATAPTEMMDKIHRDLPI